MRSFVFLNSLALVTGSGLPPGLLKSVSSMTERIAICFDRVVDLVVRDQTTTLSASVEVEREIPVVNPALDVLLAIPSPSVNSIGVGALRFNAYGMCIALGAIMAVWLARRRWEARGQRGDDVVDIAVWAVPGGLIGARIYHIINDWRPWHEWHEIWNGGLGIGGGLLAGVLVGWLVARRRGLDTANLLDAAIPGIPVGQAIGRFGNWFNQENFGRPTDLPWALEIDPEHRPPGFENDETFHPAFLYESIWNVLLTLALIAIDRRGVLKRGMILPVWVVGYSIGRLWIEAIRIDPNNEVFGLRFNLWVYGIALVGGLIACLIMWRRGTPSHYANDGSPGPDADSANSADDDDDDDDLDETDESIDAAEDDEELEPSAESAGGE